MEFSKKKNITIIFSAVFLFAILLYVIAHSESTIFTDFIYEKVETSEVSETKLDLQEDLIPKKIESEVSAALSSPPPIIRGVYVTNWSAASRKYLLYLDQIFKTTQINTVVIDIKDYSGTVVYETRAKKAREYKTFSRSLIDINNLVRNFHDQGVYVIARINIFNDQALAKVRPGLAIYSKSKSEGQQEPVLWKDSSGLRWLDPASEEVWDYNIEIAADALSHGFDEVNFDYIRFPSDGAIEDIGYPIKGENISRRAVIKSFFQKIRESLPNATLSVDLFGQTTIITNGDMGVGQVFEDAFDYFNYVCPMIYPSHYVNGFMGFDNPAEHPYEVVKNALDNAVLRRSVHAKENPENPSQPVDQLVNGVRARKLAEIRPWIQDFNLGANYDANMVSQEIKAVKDSMGEIFNGFMLWNPSNFYTTEAIIRNTADSN